MNSAMTLAKIGRSIKKRAMHYSCKHADIAFDGRVLESAAVVTVVTAIRPSGLPEPPCCRLYRRFYRKRAALHSKLARTASRAPACPARWAPSSFSGSHRPQPTHQKTNQQAPPID